MPEAVLPSARPEPMTPSTPITPKTPMRHTTETTRITRPTPRIPPTLATILALACAATLVGCATSASPSADTRAPVAAADIPELPTPAGTTVAPGLAIDRWWHLLDDPSLDRLIDDALQRNHDLAAAAARVREAQARLDELRGGQAPSLDLQAHSARSRQSGDAGLPAGAPLTGSNHAVSLAGRWELDLWGRLSSASEAGRARLLAQEWARAGVEWGLTAQLAEAHFRLRAVQRQTEIGEAMRASRAATVSLRRREQAAGIGSEFDLRRAEAEAAGTDATLADLRRQRAALESTIALLAGRPLAELAPAEAPRAAMAVSADPSRDPPPRLPQGDAASFLLRRPDVRQAEAQLAAAQADIAAARAATLPSVVLTGSAGSDARSLSRLFDGPGFVWSVAAGLTQSLFDGGQAQARVRQADARADAAYADYQRVVLAAVLDLRESYAALEWTQQARVAGHERVAALERARRLAEIGHASGAIAYLDLLDAERNSFQAQLDEVGAQRDRLIGQVAAFKALGGGHAGVATLAESRRQTTSGAE